MNHLRNGEVENINAALEKFTFAFNSFFSNVESALFKDFIETSLRRKNVLKEKAELQF